MPNGLLVMSKDIVNLLVNPSIENDSVNVHECQKYLKLETELQTDFIKRETYDKLFKFFTILEKHCISLEVDTQLKQEIFQRENSVSNQSVPIFDQLFELNELKAQSQEKDTIIKNDPELHQVNVEPITPKLLNKRTAHSAYIKHSQEEAVVLRDLVDHIKANYPLDPLLESACRPDYPHVYLGLRDANRHHDREIALSNNFAQQSLGHRLGHNLFFVGQFCDSNLEVAFRQHTCYIRNLEGVDLLTGSRGDNLYTLSLGDMMASSPICLLSKASKTRLGYRHRVSLILNFGRYSHLARHGKSTKKPHKPKSEDTNQEKLYLLHMDLCGPMHVDDQVRLKEIVLSDAFMNRYGTEFVNQTLLCNIIENGWPLSYETSGGTGQVTTEGRYSYFPWLCTHEESILDFNRRTRQIVETIHVDFDELAAMASEHSSSGPTLHEMTHATISSGLVPNPHPSTPVDHPAPEVFPLGLHYDEQALFCYYDAFLTAVEPKTYKDALPQACWIESMQEELNEFERLEDFEDQKARLVAVVTVKRMGTWSREEGTGGNHLKSFCFRCKIRGYKDFSRVCCSYEHGRIPNGYFSKGSVDPILFIRRDGKELLLVQIYVDDIIFAASTPELYTQWVEKSQTEVMRIKKGKAVDRHTILGLIDWHPYLYLTASRPDLQFAICMCAWYQARPTEKHLNAVKGSFDADHVVLFQATTHIALLRLCLNPLDESQVYRLLGLDSIKLQCFCEYKSAIAYQLADVLLSSWRNRKLNSDQQAGICEVLRRIMDITKAEHIALDDALVAPANQLKIEYYAIASGEVPPKTKASVHKKKADSDTTPKEKPPTDPKDKRVKQTGKMTGLGKQKQPATGLETLSEIALTETEQLKIATKRSRIQTLNSQASGSGDGVDILSKVPDEQVHEKTGTDEGAGDKPEVPDVPEHHSNSEEESWTFSDGDDDDEEDDDDEDDDANKDSDAHDDDDDATESDDDGDNITHPKLSTFSTDDQEENNDEEEQEEDDEDEEEISDQLVCTPSDYQTSDESEKQKDDDRVKDGEEDKEGDVTNVNLEGGDVDMTEADTTKDTKDTHVTLTAATPIVQQQSSSVSDLVSKFISPTTDEGIDSILTPHTESTTLVNVPISVATETPATTTTIPPPLFPVTQSSQQTPVTTTTTTNPSTTNTASIPNMPLKFGFNQRVTALESDLSKLKQSNPFAEGPSHLSGQYPTYDLIKGTCKSVAELDYHLEEVFKDTNEQLDWNNPKGTPYPHNLSKPLPLIPNARGRLLYKFREGDFKRLRRQDIEDMLLLLVQGKLTNLNLDERYALNVALRMYTRRIVIQERVEDLQLGVESYQKKINLSRPDSYRSDLRKMTPYTAYPDIQGIIYQDDMDRNRLMRTEELHKFSDGTLNHVRTALNDIATGIQMEYLPKRKWSKQDKQRARVMINAIDKKLRDRRLMRSLEKFVGGRPYGGDLRLLERTI
ncbi:hypothetical protein Tco_1569871 [Tanacetum coccineum]